MTSHTLGSFARSDSQAQAHTQLGGGVRVVVVVEEEQFAFACEGAAAGAKSFSGHVDDAVSGVGGWVVRRRCGVVRACMRAVAASQANVWTRRQLQLFKAPLHAARTAGCPASCGPARLLRSSSR